MTDPPILYCANHPQVETSLRCNKCEKPICIKCAVLTPTGYRCRECVRGQQKVFETAQWYDYPLAFVTVAVLTYLGSLLATIMGFLTIFVAPLAGGIIAETARFVVRRRRSKLLFQLVAVAAAVGSLPVLLFQIAGILALMSATGAISATALLRLLWPGIYAVFVTSTVYYRMAGINVKY